MPAPQTRSPKKASPPKPRPAPRIQPFEIRQSPVHGRGAFATRPIRKGSIVAEYTGERISTKTADARYDEDTPEGHHTFLFVVDGRTVIDAQRVGGDARFINHSCGPNCESFMEDKRIFITALRDIAVGEELNYDYSLEREEPYAPKWKQYYICRCGAPNCRGTLLHITKPKKAAKKAAKKTVKAAKKGTKAAAPAKAAKKGKKAVKRSTAKGR